MTPLRGYMKDNIYQKKLLYLGESKKLSMEGNTAPKGRNIQTMGTAHRIEDGTAHQLTSQNLWDSHS